MANRIPIGIWLLPSCNALDRTFAYRIYILLFTFLIYTSYHLSRKPISVVKNALFHNSCHQWEPDVFAENSTDCDWAPFDHADHDDLLGSLDLAYLFAYAVGMFLSGHIAERMDLRHFLTLGMLSSGLLTAAFGFGYFFKIHVLWFYILVQVVGGVVQASGWPSVVTCVGNWWGKGKRGFIMGVWNSHTSVGNITGSLIAGIWVNYAWGWSFVVPGIIIGVLGIVVFFFLVTEPSIVGCQEPDQHDPTDFSSSTVPDQVHVQNGPREPNDNHHVEHVDSKSPTSETDGITVYILDSEPDKPQIAYTQPVTSHHVAETKLSNSKNGDLVNGKSKGIELLNILSLENQSETGSNAKASESSLVSSQNGAMIPVKKDYNSATSVTPLLKKPGNRGDKSEEKAISIFRAIFIPGVLEFSLCLFFAKLVSYTFLFWLPKYISSQNKNFDAEESADLSTLFDVGGILGGITAGIISDYTGARAGTCAVMLILAAPMMYVLNEFGAIDYAHTIGLLMACGFLVNGPYALITTAVSADLGTHKSLKGNSKALATVTAIIDGTGSIGAAIGPLLTGLLWKYGTTAVFWMLIGADLAALVFLFRLVFKEIKATRFCSPPLLVDDIVVDDDHEPTQNNVTADKTYHF